MEPLYLSLALLLIIFVSLVSIIQILGGIREIVKVIKDNILDVEVVLVNGTNTIRESIQNNTNIVKETNDFLKDKGFSITLVSGLKEKLEEAMSPSVSETQGPSATPASFTGKV